MYNEYIINNEESYTGEYIKKWCECHIQIGRLESEYHIEAEDIYYNYFQDDNQFKPNPIVYYFIWRDRNYRGFVETHLERDLDKSPRKQITA